MNYNTLSYEYFNDICLLKMNRPAELNALSSEVFLELEHFITTRETKILILTGSGEKAFCAGADIKEMSSKTLPEIQSYIALGQRVMNVIESAPFVTISAMNGLALGGGLELALSTDFIYASTKAKMGLPEVTLGLIPGFGGTQRLARALGSVRNAKELIYTGCYITSEEAFSLKLVSKVFEPEQLIPRTIEVAQKISEKSFKAILKAKKCLNYGEDMPLERALQLEQESFALCFAQDGQEGLRAFGEKRAPRFS